MDTAASVGALRGSIVAKIEHELFCHASFGLCLQAVPASLQFCAPDRHQMGLLTVTLHVLMLQRTSCAASCYMTCIALPICGVEMAKRADAGVLRSLHKKQVNAVIVVHKAGQCRDLFDCCMCL